MEKSDLRKLKNILAKQKFLVLEPEFYFQCHSAVFGNNHENSLLYTTSEDRAELLADILNEWAQLREENKVFRKLVKELKKDEETDGHYFCLFCQATGHEENCILKKAYSVLKK